MTARRTCEQCGSLMPPFVPRRTMGGRKVCEGCATWHAKTSLKVQAALENPIHKRTGKDEHEWFHGSKHEFHEFGDPEHDSPLSFAEDHEDNSHWNTLLGNHFTSDHQVAADFANGGHSSAANSSGSASGRVIHTKLHLKNPKVYASEHDMDQEVHEFEHKRGNTIDSHFPPPSEAEAKDWDQFDWEDHHAEMGQAQHYANDSEKPFGRHESDPGQAYGNVHPKAVGWLNHHPDKYNIAVRFKHRLQDAGHDGIVYGNEYEQSNHGSSATSAIAFHPHQIEITQDHTVNKNCLKPGDLSRRPGPGQEMLPGTENLPSKRPYAPPPGDWHHPKTWHDPKMWRESKMTPHGVDWGRLTAPLPQECWDRYHGRQQHTGAKKHTYTVQRYAPQGGYETVEKEIEGPLYHGGRGKLQPGDMITPGRKPNSWGDEGPKSTHVYFSTDKDTAASYSQQLGNKGHLYEVEPTGEFRTDYGPQDYKTQHPLRVVRKVPREEWQLGSTASNSNDPWRWEQHQTRWDTKRPAIEHTKDLGAFTLHAEPVNEDGDREIHAVTPEGRYIGSTYFGQHPSLTSYQEGAPEVHPDHRRRGVASAMYDWAEELGGKPMAPAVSHTEDAAGFWSTRKQATVYPGHETALHEMGQQTVYPVSTPRGVTNLCQHHLNVHQSISAGSNDLAGHLGIPQAPSEPLGASKTGTCAECHKNTDYQLKLQRPEGFDRQQQRDSQQPRTRRSGPYVPAKTKPLTPLRHSENSRSGASDNEIRRSRNGSSGFLRDETTNSVVSGGSNRRAPAPALDHLRGSAFSQVSASVSPQKSDMPHYFYHGTTDDAEYTPEDGYHSGGDHTLRPGALLHQSANEAWHHAIKNWTPNYDFPRVYRTHRNHIPADTEHHENGKATLRSSTGAQEVEHDTHTVPEGHPELRGEGEDHHQTLFHGTAHDEDDDELEHIHPGASSSMFGAHASDPSYAYATPRLNTAWTYAEKRAEATGGRPAVYRVTPHKPEDVEDDPLYHGERSRGNYTGDLRSKSGFKVLDPVPMSAKQQHKHDEDVAERDEYEHDDDDWGDSHYGMKKEDRMKKLPTLRMLAHDATENQEIRHCPMCGGGKIIGRQDGSVECEYCHSYFTVQIQPQFPNFPQTIDGMPQQIPGMPGQVETPPGATVPGQEMPPGEEGSEDGGNPFAAGGDGDADDAGGPPDGDADDSGGDEPPPFAKKSFKTVTGAVLDEDDYARHMAIRLAPDRAAMIAVVRQEQGAR